MDTLGLSASELILMASYLGAEEFFGIENPFFGMSEKETQAALEDAQSTLAEKRYAALDFEGNFSPSEVLKHLSGVCAFCERYVAVDILEKGAAQNPVRFYFRGSSAVRLSGDGAIKLESVSAGQIDDELMGLAEKYAPAAQAIVREPVTLPLSALAKAQAASDNAGKQRASLITGGCPEPFAAILTDGFQRQADYCTITLMDFAAKRVDSVLCLISEHGTLRLVPANVDGADCWTLSNIDTPVMRAAIAAMLHESLEQLGKGGESDASL